MMSGLLVPCLSPASFCRIDGAVISRHFATTAVALSQSLFPRSELLRAGHSDCGEIRDWNFGHLELKWDDEVCAVHHLLY